MSGGGVIDLFKIEILSQKHAAAGSICSRCWEEIGWTTNSFCFWIADLLLQLVESCGILGRTFFQLFPSISLLDEAWALDHRLANTPTLAFLWTFIQYCSCCCGCSCCCSGSGSRCCADIPEPEKTIDATSVDRKETKRHPPCAADHLGLFVADLSLELLEGSRVLFGAFSQLFPLATLSLKTWAAWDQLALHSSPVLNVSSNICT